MVIFNIFLPLLRASRTELFLMIVKIIGRYTNLWKHTHTFTRLAGPSVEAEDEINKQGFYYFSPIFFNLKRQLGSRVAALSTTHSLPTVM